MDDAGRVCEHRGLETVIADKISVLKTVKVSNHITLLHIKNVTVAVTHTHTHMQEFQLKCQVMTQIEHEGFKLITMFVGCRKSSLKTLIVEQI